MINVIDKHNCCGCSACASICPKRCIQMVADNEGFLYPQVDMDTCIDCALCEKVCNELQPYENENLSKYLQLSTRTRRFDSRVPLEASSTSLQKRSSKKMVSSLVLALMRIGRW